MALAVALVVGASLLVRSFVALGASIWASAPDRLLVMQTSVPTRDARGRAARDRVLRALLPRLAAVPGVTRSPACAACPTPAHASATSNGGYWLEGGRDPEVAGVRLPQAVFTVVTPDYFRTMAIPLSRGRDFSERDRDDAPFVAIVNEALARQAFGDVDPIGRHIVCGLDSPKFMTIVGVVGDVRSRDPSRAPVPEIYMPFQQHPLSGDVARDRGAHRRRADGARRTRSAKPSGRPTRSARCGRRR